MTIEWPTTPTPELFRSFVASWCLAPCAAEILWPHRDPPRETSPLDPHPALALLLMARRHHDGRLEVFVARWGSFEPPPPRLDRDLARCDEASALLARMYGEDPLADGGPLEPAFGALCADDGSSAVVAVASQSSHGLLIRGVDAPLPVAPPSEEWRRRRIALLHLTALEESWQRLRWRRQASLSSPGAAWEALRAKASLLRAAAGLPDPPAPAVLQAATSEELRAQHAEMRLRPLAGRLFAQRPEARSLTCAVAQYWSGGPEDEVHEAFVPSPHATTLPWRASLAANPMVDAVPLPGGGVDHDVETWAPILEALVRGLPELGPDGLTRAFASCVPEAIVQGRGLEAFTPWAVARRGADGGIEIEIVGAVLRPEWEDADEASRASLLDRATTPPVRIPATRPWWRRLLRLR